MKKKKESKTFFSLTKKSKPDIDTQHKEYEHFKHT